MKKSAHKHNKHIEPLFFISKKYAHRGTILKVAPHKCLNYIFISVLKFLELILIFIFSDRSEIEGSSVSLHRDHAKQCSPRMLGL